MEQLWLEEIDSPIGRVGLVHSPLGVARIVLPGDQVDRGLSTHAHDASSASAQLAEYFTGHRRVFDVPLDLRFTTGFRAHVLLELARVPFGCTTTYRELAQKAGNPGAVRAVGGACANNPLPLIVPCHRVLRSDGQLGGYRGGENTKRFLLSLEGIDV